MSLDCLSRRALLVSLVMAAGGCSAITDPDRFDVCGDGRKRLDANFVGFEELAGERFELLVTASGTGRVVARAVVETLHPEHDQGGAQFTVLMPCAVPRGDHELRTFIDEDRDGQYTSPSEAAAPGEEDLAFQVPIEGNGVVFVDRDGSPEADISENLDTDGLEPFVMNLRNMSPHTPGQQRLELRVVDVTADEDATPFVAGYYRLGDVTENAFSADVPTVIVPGRSYRIDFYADLSDNGDYDDPPEDHAWIEPDPSDEDAPNVFTGRPDGLVIDFSHRGTFDDLRF